MKVYCCILEIPWEYCELRAVFSTKELAEKYIFNNKKDEKHSGGKFIIEEHEIKKEKKYKCVSCQKIFPESKIIFDVDPYDEEINGGTEKVWECEFCRKSSVADI